MKDSKFKVGERVMRGTRRGVVELVYLSALSQAGGERRQYHLYAIRWEDTKNLEHGYMELGLDREPLASVS